MSDKFTIGPDCWDWHGVRTTYGYGRIRVGGRAAPMLMAHRVLYELVVGPIPDGLELDHLCENTSCIRPSHLEPVTHVENMLRRRNRRTHCKNGHELTPENTYIRPAGHRDCHTCRKRGHRTSYLKQKETI